MRPEPPKGLMRSLPLLAALLASACVPDPLIGPLDPDGGNGGSPERLTTITETIFVPKCATSACHAGHPPAAAPGSYELEWIWGDIVDVPSQQLAGMDVVEPFEPESSYLVYKLRGTAGMIGGNASPMPIGDLLLTEAEIQAVEAWIRNGAPND
jgi:mono/diheme cytochrome c family protein